MDLVKKIAALPHAIIFQGATFYLVLYPNGGGVSIFYRLVSVGKNSPRKGLFESDNAWENPFLGTGKYLCNYLWAAEYCGNESELLRAIDDCIAFFRQNNIT